MGSTVDVEEPTLVRTTLLAKSHPLSQSDERRIVAFYP